jgi:hypothetical protein
MIPEAVESAPERRQRRSSARSPGTRANLGRYCFSVYSLKRGDFVTTRGWAFALLGLWLSAFSAGAASIDFEFNASLQTGNLAGTNFTGTAAYSDQGSTGKGAEVLSLTSLNFSLLGFPFTLADVGLGGQVMLENGVPSDFLAAFFPDSSASPVTALAFGFGGQGIINYSTGSEPNFGGGVYDITTTAVPEPSAVAFLGFSCLLSTLAFRRRIQALIIPQSGILVESAKVNLGCWRRTQFRRDGGQQEGHDV